MDKKDKMNKNTLSLSDYDFELPKELIAQKPLEKRDESKLMVLDKNSKNIEHMCFGDLPELLSENDVLVRNNTKVIPARFYGKRKSGGKLEGLFINIMTDSNNWEVLMKSSKRMKIGEEFIVCDYNDNEITTATLVGDLSEGRKEIHVVQGEGVKAYELLERIGEPPLPPYILREKGEAARNDKERYQTVFAENLGSVAAPTAGLHFTDEILEAIKQKGVQTISVTLHVGLGTFLPVRTENIDDHKMHSEFYTVSKESVNLLREAVDNKKNIVCVGTTSARVLESVADDLFTNDELSGWTDIFIYPSYEFKLVKSLITNFHLPMSTLLMMVSALAGKDFIFEAYQEAVSQKYRFFSYGDAMFIR